MLLKGMTAEYLLRRTYRVKAGETILVHAAAGGVGLRSSCQWAKHLGATVIGTVGSEDKAALAKAQRLRPCHPLSRARISSPSASARSPSGKGVPVVYDSVGKDTFDGIARLPGAARA